MPVRHCPHCRTSVVPGARFCAQCGEPLVAGARPASDWRVTGTGASVLGFFLIAGLAIWTGILSPAPPRPGPGAAAGPVGAPAAAVPEGHPQVPVELPADVKSFIADMQAKAQQAPKDVATWVKVGRVTARAAQLDPAYYSAALAQLKTARGLASEDDARRQIDDMIATLSGDRAKGSAPAPSAPSAAGSPFQQAVEGAFRGHPIMGPRIVRFDWTTPTSGRVVVRDFSMDGMPAAVREKFSAHLAEMLRTAAQEHPAAGPVRMEIADAATAAVMATVAP